MTMPDEHYEDLQALLDVMKERLAAIDRFVDAFAAVDPADTSPEERRRLQIANERLGDALDQFE